MIIPCSKALLISFFLLPLLCLSTPSPNFSSLNNFLQCLPHYSNSYHPISQTIYTPTNSSFQSVLQAYIRNTRFLTPTTPKPLAIITATHESHVQATVICAKSQGLQIRIRSGGHDYEGLSYTSHVPFLILDMSNLRSIEVDVTSETAWIQAGATNGELYYKIANKSQVHGFPAGVCVTLGVGGHFSGGGYGNMMRKYGLSVDNIIDAQLVDVNGRILSRKSMGEDLFWAIRGGGGASFGVILSWKVKLVQVPAKVTVFNVGRTLEQGGTDLVYRWQQVAPDLDNNLFIRAVPQVVVDGGSNGGMTIRVAFVGLFLGRVNQLLPLMRKAFPELGLQSNDCNEVSWIESVLSWAGYSNGTSPDVLLNRATGQSVFFKGKSDFVKTIIPKSGLESIWSMMYKVGPTMLLEFSPQGGMMSEISEEATPFPHRAGYLYNVQHFMHWTDSSVNADEQIDLMRNMYAGMAPYVTKDPRAAFLNYRDLDIGSNPSNITNLKNAQVYGSKYFNKNFIKLAKVKARVDPDNFFRHEQSIPPCTAC